LDVHFQALFRRIQALDSMPIGDTCAIGITSSTRGEGTTTVSVNLAIQIASIVPKPVLLVDGNTGAPSLHQLFKLKDSPGLVEILDDKASVTNCVHETKARNLHVLPAGGVSKRISLAYRAMMVDSFLEDVKRDFGCVIIDLPEAHELTLCFTLGSRLDGVILVVEADKVVDRTVRRACEQLLAAGTNLLGTVFNKRQRLPRWLM